MPFSPELREKLSNAVPMSSGEKQKQINKGKLEAVRNAAEARKGSYYKDSKDKVYF